MKTQKRARTSAGFPMRQVVLASVRAPFWMMIMFVAQLPTLFWLVIAVSKERIQRWSKP